jgi:NAD-dependent SIR2 family protein deacetylase
VDYSTLTATAADRDGSAAVVALGDLLDLGGVVVLSGAGVSTESGIPDYRGPTGAARRYAPMTYQAFVGDAQARRRYWARSYLGWRQISRARPNAGHHAVATLQAAGAIRGIITQNVDGLHQAAGARDVIELHGGLHRTICLTCGDRSTRVAIDSALREANPTFDARARAINPDGDAELSEADLDRFVMVTCAVCRQGPLKPDVVFFGEAVPRERVERCYQLVERARALLVLGSSLAVMSGYRFVVRATKLQIPVAIVNQGSTRADGCASIRVDAPLGVVLPALAAGYLGRRLGP